MRSYTLLLSGLCSLMLGSTLLTAQAERASAKVVTASASSQEEELEPLVVKLESDGQNTTLDAETAQLLGLSNVAVPIRARAVKKGTEQRIVGLVRESPARTLVFLQVLGDHSYVFLTGPDGRLKKGFWVRGPVSKPVDASEPSFGAMKQYWKSRLLRTPWDSARREPAPSSAKVVEVSSSRRR